MEQLLFSEKESDSKVFANNYETMMSIVHIMEPARYFQLSNDSFSMGEYEELFEKIQIPQDDPLTIQEFSLVRNNFHLYFCEESEDLILGYRLKPVFQKFLEESPDLVNKLTRTITSIIRTYYPDSKKISLLVNRQNYLLYKVYLIMRDHVETDWELFR